jgi:small conductance mechanosensitive channel
MVYPIGQINSDGRLLSNLIAVHLLVLVWLALSVALRWLLTRGAARFGRWSKSDRVRQFSVAATKNGQAMLFWLTLIAMVLTVVGALIYHVSGFDARHHATDLSSTFRHEHFVRLGLTAGALIIVWIATSAVVRVIRRLLPVGENLAIAQWGRPKTEAALRKWFALFEIFMAAAIRLTAVWLAVHIVGLGRWKALGDGADKVFGLVLYVVCVIGGARLLSLAWRAASHLLGEHGNQHLAKTPLRHYWERLTRLFPLGERCFDGAVYFYAAALVVNQLHIVVEQIRTHTAPALVSQAHLAVRFHEIVDCIGIFFATRVLIEFCQVLLNEAFGVYRPERAIDQKARTLLPLLQSVSQYLLYFGSVVAMLHALQLPTAPIMAGAGILGLAVGFGAQSLVTDIVSGFFILFENQFLVGDYVKIDDASGIVEEVSIRVTKIRDGQGKLHIIPNGQIKGVVSYSKGYVNAVVDVKLPAGGDMESLFRAMTEAGQRLKANRHEVLADTEIHGVVEWSGSDMTIRAVTRVEPGTHGIIQNEYRKVLRQVLDEKQAAPLQKPALAA